jgi:hypothetical protein
MKIIPLATLAGLLCGCSVPDQPDAVPPKFKRVSVLGLSDEQFKVGDSVTNLDGAVALFGDPALTKIDLYFCQDQTMRTVHNVTDRIRKAGYEDYAFMELDAARVAACNAR